MGGKCVSVLLGMSWEWIASKVNIPAKDQESHGKTQEISSENDFHMAFPRLCWVSPTKRIGI